MRIHLLRCAIYFWLGALALGAGKPVILPPLVRITVFDDRVPLVALFVLAGLLCFISAWWQNAQLRLVAMSFKLAVATFFAALLLAAAVLTGGSWFTAVTFLVWTLYDMVNAVRYWALTGTQERAVYEALRRIRRQRRETEQSIDRATAR